MPTRILCTGLSIPEGFKRSEIIHCPLIRIVPREVSNPDIQACLSKLERYTHLLFTSKNAATLFQQLVDSFPTSSTIVAVGQATARSLPRVDWIADEPSAEGIVTLLETLDPIDPYILWPHSSRARSVITDFLKQQKWNFDTCILYDTVPQKPDPLPNLDTIDEILFTSPSTVDAFLEIFGPLPHNKILTAIGPITKKYLEIKTASHRMIKKQPSQQ